MTGNEHILVVDDDPQTRLLFSRRLENAGYRVSQAVDGVEALVRVKDRDPDLVLLDIQMPGKNGIEVLTELRSAHTARELPVIMATANQDDEMLERALSLGANDYIVKPISSTVLLARVKSRLLTDPDRSSRDVDTTSPAVQVAVSSAPSMTDGDVLDNRYRLGEQIGRGGYGTIHKATHIKLGRRVAIKVVRLDRMGPAALSAFEHEGVAACRVDHPNAVDIFDVGRTPEGVPYLVMEYLEGDTLRVLHHRSTQRGQRMTIRRAVDIMMPVAFVLAVAHERGIVHRDIKPENIFIDTHNAREVVKVLDFGLAAFREELVAQEKEDTVQGSPSYLAPERVAGLPHDGSVDVYAAGCVLFELLCGRPPFVREPGQSLTDLAASHILKLPPGVEELNPEAPKALTDLVADALEKKPSNRLSSSRFALRLAAVRDALIRSGGI